MRAVAFISHQFTHHLDHLAPLCAIFACPLVVDHPDTFRLARQFYPNVDCRLEEPIHLAYWGEQVDLILLSTKSAAKELKVSFAFLGRPDMRFCFCPHGQSDKWYKKSENNPFPHQDIALVYGKKMEQQLHKKRFLEKLNASIRVGNYRLWFYQKHKDFYDQLLAKTLPVFQNKERQVYLFAPTWNDGENPSSFFDKAECLLETLPRHIHLILKLHPLLEKQSPGVVHALIEKYRTLSNIDILIHYPIVYPLLAYTDVYIGDYSSVGYDFLYFQKPMFFFATSSQQVSLHRCGYVIPSRETHVFSYVQRHMSQDGLLSRKKALFQKAFPRFRADIFLQELEEIMRITTVQGQF